MIKVNDAVMVKHEHKYHAPVSSHKVHVVCEIYVDGTMLLRGFPEPVKVSMFDKVKIGKVKGH